SDLTTQIIQALPAALDLATVAQIDLGRSADLTSNILASFNLHTAETARVADVLAVASSNANTDVEQLAEALKPVGGVARSLNISLEETSAVLGAMAQAGRQSGEAGTGLRAILSQLLNL